MHPLLATMIANNHAREMRTAAETRRRGRSGRPEPRRITLRRPRRTARIAAV
jgi:hypothetical protein